MTKRLTILVVVFAFLVAGNAVYYLSRPKEKVSPEARFALPSSKVEQKAAERIEPAPSYPEEEVLDWGRDPFTGSGEEGMRSSLAENAALGGETTVAVKSPFVFYGSWLSPGGNLALVGESVVAEGELVEGWRVLKISENSVELERDGRRETVFLPEPSQ